MKIVAEGRRGDWSTPFCRVKGGVPLFSAVHTSFADKGTWLVALGGWYGGWVWCVRNMSEGPSEDVRRCQKCVARQVPGGLHHAPIDRYSGVYIAVLRAIV